MSGLGAGLLAAGLASSPVLDTLSPDRGLTTGGERVILAGSGFQATDEVLVQGPTVFSPPGDVCDDGFPLCSNNRCALSQARGSCTINGVAGLRPFTFFTDTWIDILTPGVGTSGAGSAEVLVRSATGDASGARTFTFELPISFRPPRIDGLSATAFSGDGCCPDGSWNLAIFGWNFRPCFSLVLVSNPGVLEILPTPDVTDCGERRGLSSPRELMLQRLPPDGMTIDCARRPDILPLRHDSGVRYFHDLMCDGLVPRPFCANPAVLQDRPPDPAHSTRGGAVSWVSDSEIHVEFGPEVLPDCLSTRRLLLFVQNEPGRGLAGDLLSNEAELSFTNTRAGTPPPDQGNGLLAARQGNDVTLEQTTGAAAQFRLFRDPGKLTLAGTPLGAATTARTWLDRAAPSPAFYRVRGVDCGTAEGP